MPAISLIIPCYNTPEAQLRRALESVAAQGFDDFELLLVDDGSEASFRPAYARLAETAHAKLITTENQGVSAARNTAAAAASGDYLAFLDADDALTDRFFAEAYDLARQTEADFIIGGVVLTNEISGFSANDARKPMEYDVYEGADALALRRFFVCRELRMDFPGCTITKGPVARLIRRELFQAHPFRTELSIGEDQVWNLEVLSAAPRVCVAHRHWYWYWQNEASAMHQFRADYRLRWEAQLAAVRDCLNLHDETLYRAYVMHIYDGVFYTWRCYFRYPADTSEARAVKRAERRAIYHEAPWTELANPRFYRSAPRKYRLYSLLYRARVLLPVLGAWQRLKALRG